MPPNCADMAGKRLLYLAIVVGCSIFYAAYGEWLSHLILAVVLALPWFSLLLSLPAIFCFQAVPAGPTLLEQGGSGELWLLGSCAFPMPPFRGKLRLTRPLSGETWYYQSQEDLRTDHCGAVTVTVEALRICDYLGLFSFPVRSRTAKTVLVRPRPMAVPVEQELQRQIARSWQPKFGGGYAENHELRQYRPGDCLNQVHWKLSAKTGDLIIREPMEPRQGLVLLTMNLRGSDEELDRKMGRFLWMGTWLLEQTVPFELRTLTGDGLLTFSVSSEAALKKTVDTLLCQKPVRNGDLRGRDFTAAWHYHIGGGADEA